MAGPLNLHQEAEMTASATDVFDVIADLRGYGNWLGRSTAYLRGTTDISPGPIGVGTTYVEREARGVRRGTVIECERPTRLSFRQPMTLRPRLFGTIDITVGYALTPAGESVHVDRDVAVSIPAWLRPFGPLVMRSFRSEGARTLRALKRFAESRSEGASERE